MFWHAWLAFHPQRHPHLSWHLCGPAKSSAQQDLGTQIISSTILFSSVQNNSTDRVRCHPWSALIFWNAKIKQYAWPPSAPFDLLFGSNPSFFSIIYQKIITIHPAEFFFFFFSFFVGQNGLECDSMWNYRRLTRKLHLPHIPENVIPGDFSQKKPKKKRKNRKKKHGVRRFYGVRRSCWVREFYSMCVSLAVECDVPCGVRRNYGMRRILSMRGWYRDHRGKFRGQNQKSNPKASPNFQGHTS